MNIRVYLLLFFLGIVPVSLVAMFQHTPGYMDADYYYSGGLRLAEGYGFTEEILWNYLDDPAGIPHPSNAYWMPLASIISWLGIAFLNSIKFSSARLGFVMIAGCIAPITCALAYSITRDRRQAIFAGILAAIPGFYLSYLGTTDTFGLSMLLGALWFLLVGVLNQSDRANVARLIGVPFVMGLVNGLFHLLRADGVTWLIVSGVALVSSSRGFDLHTIVRLPIGSNKWLLLIRSVVFAIGYLIVVSPWMIRNFNAFNTFMAPGGDKVLWLTDYDELFIYPASVLTPARWLESGWAAILQARWYAFGQNLQSALAVQGEIFLAPLILIGLWQWRQDVCVRLGILAWIITLGVMSVLFPYAGWRGGYFHSGAAIQPLLWAVAPIGLERFIVWGSRVRKWNAVQARTVFRAGLVALAILVSVLAVRNRVVGRQAGQPIWNRGTEAYRELDTALQTAGASRADIVMVNNAPGYYVANRRPALSIPDGSIHASIDVARRYGAKYLLLEENHPKGLDALYRNPEDFGELKYLKTYKGAHIFEIQD